MKELEIYISTILIVVLIALSAVLLYGSLITGAYIVKPSYSPSAEETNWPMFHHDINNSGFVGIDGPKTNNSIWHYTTLGAIRSSPAIWNKMIYFGSYDNNLYALDLQGNLKWAFATSGLVHSSPAVANGLVYFGSFDGHVYALNATTGSQVWNFSTGAQIESSPTVWNGTLYIGSSTTGGQVWAIDALTGATIWNNSVCYSASAPVVANGLVYFGCGDGVVRAFGALNGSLVWNFTTSGPIGGSPAYSPITNTIYIGSDDGSLYALDGTTGAQIWNFSTGSVIRSTPAIAGDRIIFGSYDNRSYILDFNGVEICNFSTGNNIHSSAAIANNIAYFGSFNGKLYAINISNCEQIWTYDIGFPIWSSPAIVSGSALLSIGAGDELWTFTDCIDEDGDGYNVTGGLCGPVDCNDNNPSIYPGATEKCNNAIDDDCDGKTDCSDPDCSSDPACAPAPSPTVEERPRPTGGFKIAPKPKVEKKPSPPKPPKEYNLTWHPKERRLELTYKRHQSISKIDIYFKEGVAPPEDFEFKAQTKPNRECKSELRNTVLSCTQIETNLSYEGIERVELQLKVPNILLAERRIDLDSLLAIKNKETLKVEEVGADNSYTYFKITASSFSIFALLGNAIPPLIIDIKPLQLSIIMLGICAALWIALLVLYWPRKIPRHLKPLHEYVKRAKKAGLSREEIKSRALTVGWSEEQLEEILKRFF